MASMGWAFTIGEEGWHEGFQQHVNEYCPDLFEAFKPHDEAELSDLEAEIGRRLPGDFRDFLMRVGSGRFPDYVGGDVYSPSDISASLLGPMHMIRGVVDQATEELYRQLYVTKDRASSIAGSIPQDFLFFDGVSLLNLLQFGSDGCGCYHQLHLLGHCEKESVIGYYLLTPDPALEEAAASFEAWLSRMMELLRSNNN